MELNSPKPTAKAFGGVAFGARAQREPSPRSRRLRAWSLTRLAGEGASPSPCRAALVLPLGQPGKPPCGMPNAAALRQTRCARWSVLAAGQQGALGARHCPLIDLFRFTPQFFPVCLFCDGSQPPDWGKGALRPAPRSPHPVAFGAAASGLLRAGPCPNQGAVSFCRTANVKELGRKN